MVKIMENPIKMDDLGGKHTLFLVQHPVEEPKIRISTVDLLSFSLVFFHVIPNIFQELPRTSNKETCRTHVYLDQPVLIAV